MVLFHGRLSTKTPSRPPFFQRLLRGLPAPMPMLNGAGWLDVDRATVSDAGPCWTRALNFGAKTDSFLPDQRLFLLIVSVQSPPLKMSC